jgi:hypothetical protein
MHNEDNPQQERPDNLNSPGRSDTQTGQQQTDEARTRKEEEERKRRMRGGDQGKVGQDTDGDGKVVRPGQSPGQSGGKGLPD